MKTRLGADDDMADISPESVRAELDRILASPTFAQSESLKRFLRHVVETKLDGREQELKELSLGSEVFDRGSAYDPRVDPIVRVQATRLRSKLRDYYAEAGQDSGLVITIPKGSYVPEFEKRAISDASPPGERASSSPRQGLGIAVVALALLLLGGFLLWRFFPRTSAPDPGNGEIRSIAVLPFSDMSPEGDHAFYGDGLAEEITTRLAGASGLEVVPRTTAFQFRGDPLDLRDVSERLKADAVLQGSVRREGDALRIQVQLIRSADQRQLWTETYDRPASDAFQVQEEIARSVARAVRRELAVVERDPERFVPVAGAYEPYLRGRFELERNTPLSIERSIRHFEEALERDPDYAPAYAGLADAYVLNVIWGLSAPGDTRASAREAADRALALAGSHPEPLAAAAGYELVYEWDFAAAESMLSRAAAPVEDGAGLHVTRSLIEIARGRHEDARRELERAETLAPRQPLVRHLGAVVSFQSGELEDARTRCRELLEEAPDYPITWLLLARVESALGDAHAASGALGAFERLAGETALSVTARGVVEARAGRVTEARGRLAELEAMRGAGYVPPPLVARLEAALGETSDALEDLESAVEERSFPLLWVAVDPDYAALRDEPRFRALVSRLGLD